MCVCKTGVWVWRERWKEPGGVCWKRYGVGLCIRMCAGDMGVLVYTHGETGVCVERLGYDCGWSNSGVEGETGVSLCVSVRRDWGVSVQGERGGMCRERMRRVWRENPTCVCVQSVESGWRATQGSVKGETRVCVFLWRRSRGCACVRVCVEIGLCVCGDYVVCVFSCAREEMGCVCLWSDGGVCMQGEPGVCFCKEC